LISLLPLSRLSGLSAIRVGLTALGDPVRLSKGKLILKGFVRMVHLSLFVFHSDSLSIVNLRLYILVVIIVVLADAIKVINHI